MSYSSRIPGSVKKGCVPDAQPSPVSLTRDQYEAMSAVPMRLDRRKSADMSIIELDGRRAVVKDFSGRGWLYRRWLGPWLVNREVRALESLAGIDGVPRLYGRLDRLAFVMEYVTGVPCSNLEPGELEPEFFPRLQRLVEEVHARGWVHADLRTGGNIIRRAEPAARQAPISCGIGVPTPKEVGTSGALSNDAGGLTGAGAPHLAEGLPSGRPGLIDFAAAFSREGFGGPLRRRLFALYVKMDHQGIVKLKGQLAPELLTEPERELLEHPPWPVRLARAYRRLYHRLRRQW